MNFEFIEGGETEDKMIKFGGVVANEIGNRHDKGEGGEVGLVAENYGGGGFGERRSHVGTGGR